MTWSLRANTTLYPSTSRSTSVGWAAIAATEVPAAIPAMRVQRRLGAGRFLVSVKDGSEYYSFDNRANVAPVETTPDQAAARKLATQNGFEAFVGTRHAQESRVPLTRTTAIGRRMPISDR